ncbi:TPT-domain-containing protein [Ceratobasidium sp. AG-I]|nr:TPT-domain-containing protein [Ceratobasidium sp. AG-I]
MNSNVPDVVLSIPEKCTTWSLPTPPPSLSELSTLAATQNFQPGLPRDTPRSQRPSFSHVEGLQDAQAQTQAHRGTLLPTVQPATLNLISANSASLNSSSNWPWFNSISVMRGAIGLARRQFAVAITAFSSSSAMPTFTNPPLAWWPRLTGVGAWLALYLLCNLALTLHNKRLLGVFPFPWTLTAVHAFSAAVGSWVCAWRGVFKPVSLKHPTTPLLAVFSVLYSANIAASNASLRLVSIATHQVIRAATPLFVVLFTWASQFSPGPNSRGKLGTLRVAAVSSAKLKSLTPVVLGVVFATYGDYTYTRAGLVLTLFGTALAALKTMLASKVVRAPTPTTLTPSISALPTTRSRPLHSTHFKRHSMAGYTHVRRTSAKRFEDVRVDEGYLSGDERPARSNADLRTAPTENALHPLDVLFRLSPLACVQCLIVAWMSGEVGQWSTLWSSQTQTGVWVWGGMVPMLVLNGALAFVLNYVSFVASRRAGALSMTVAANVKQVLTVLLALLVFESGTPSVAHVLGIALTLAGGVWYGRVEAQERRERKEHGVGRRERGKSLGGQEKLGV